MDRPSEAKKLRKQGLLAKEIAEKMGISESTVYTYLSTTRERRKEHAKRQKERNRIKKLKATVDIELRRFGLPLEWNNEVFSLAKKNVSSGEWRGIRYCVPVDAILQLLCRKYRVPTPVDLRRLTVKYSKRYTKGRKYSYWTVLEEIDGVEPASPSEYIKKFFSRHPSYKDEIQKMALKICHSFPRHFIQGKNPRILASACIYASSKGALTQFEIADFFQITEVALRYTLKQMEEL